MAKAKEATTSHEGRRPNYEIVAHSSGTFTRRGIHGPRLRNVGLEHITADFYQLKRGQERIHLVVMDPLAGEALNNLLAAVAPSRPRVNDMEGTIADLFYITRNRELHRDHRESKTFGDTYTAFYRYHRRPFLEALDAMPNDLNDLHHAAMNTRFIDPKTFGQTYVQEELAELAHELQKEGIGKNELDQEINRRERISADAGIGLLYLAAVRERDQLTGGREWLRFTDFLTSHINNPKVVRALTHYAFKDAHEKNITLVDTATGEIYPAGWYGYSGIRGEGQVATTRRETQLLQNGDVKYSKVFQGQEISITVAQSGERNEPGNVKIVETNIPPEMIPSAALTPVIAYRITPSEKRESLTQKELIDLVKQTAILPPHLHPDVSLGRVLLANFSPNIVDGMVRHMRLHPHGPRQALMEAQAPTLYHAFERLLLTPENPAIAAIERTA